MKDQTIQALTVLAACLSYPARAAPAADSLDVQVGYHVMYSYPAITPPTHLLDLTRQGKVGGIILFGENIGDGTVAAVNSIQAAWKQSPGYAGKPLLITTDQEGGQVRRVPGGPVQSAKQVGLSADPSSTATKTGQDAASALAAYKINGNLAPVLDVFRKPGDFEDRYQRSYSNNTNIVSTCGSAFISSQQASGIIATAKHFPGLGPAATNENTDALPVTINRSLQELRNVDEFPYKKAISSGVGMVMTSWALYPALDSKYPAGLSKAWIQDELRGRLGFKGVTISDAIEAGGLKGFGDDPNRSVLATRAGVDIILAAARNVTQGENIHKALIAALKSGSLERSPFDAATKRIIALRNTLK